jgi:sugar phosphate isomerase/epimerase
MLTRREFGKLALVAPLVRLKPDPTYEAPPSSVVDGVRLGVQTYSFRDLARTPDGDAIGPVIAAMRSCGLTECELWAEHVEPNAPGQTRDDLRRFRVETPLDRFRAIGKAFAAAGITVYAYNYSFRRDFNDAEIDRGFDIARALGASIITASTTLAVAKRVVPFAEKHGMDVAMHGHSNLNDPNQFATPASFAAAVRMSPRFKINLDIGHFTAAGFDPVAYIREHHRSITNLHIKDMKRGIPDSYQPWGEGDTPMRDVLKLLKQERWPIRAYIEYEYPGAGSPVEEVRKCLAFARQALA